MDDIDFGCKVDSLMDQREIEEKRMFNWEICGKGCVSLRSLKRYQGMKNKNAKALPGKVSSLVKDLWFKIYQQNLCFPEDIRSKFGSFDFTDNDDARKLWTYLEPVVEEVHRDAEKYYMNFYDLLHENLFSQKFEEDMTIMQNEEKV